jgi:cell division protein FtsW
LLLLTFVPFFRLTAGGASRWLNFGFISFQPSELVKIFVILYVAHVVDKRKGIMHDFFKGLLPTIGVVVFVALFILIQPDLGTTFVVLSTTMVMAIIGGANFLEMFIMALFGIRVVSFMMMRNPYQIQRLLTFMDPWKDPLGSVFITIQSLLAVGSGWFFGVGLGHSRQKFEYLPQQFTDYIYAIICEEGGFLVATIVIICFALLVSRGIRIALKSDNRFIQLLAVGISWSLGIQAIINIMVVTAMMPAKGITLPFISYGGTSLLVCLFMSGILVNLSTTIDNSKKPAL